MKTPRAQPLNMNSSFLVSCRWGFLYVGYEVVKRLLDGGGDINPPITPITQIVNQG